MASVNRCLSLLACLTAWLAHAPLVQADAPDASVPPVGYAVVVSDSATPMERRAGVLLEESGIRVRGSGIGRRESQGTIYVGPSLTPMTLVGQRVDWSGKGAGSRT